MLTIGIHVPEHRLVSEEKKPVHAVVRECSESATNQWNEEEVLVVVKVLVLRIFGVDSVDDVVGFVRAPLGTIVSVSDERVSE
jgi:hypothetical protein